MLNKTNTRIVSLTAVVVGLVNLMAMSVVARAAENMLELGYPRPAGKWIEALPIGNGRLGAMVFGGSQHERLKLNEITVWSGSPDRNADRADAYKNLSELRKMLREGRYAEAAAFANTR